ncbi:MAG: carbon storage regulator CsrA [Defluviitaleaceae bacterium]|nr:carbon storage regulator CsrA [Defluviitaleaceae bacterium]
MLALSRRRGESIIIGDNIEIVIISISGDQVKVGIAAPKCIAVNRKEIYEQIQTENRKAASITTANMSKLTRLIKKPENPDTITAAANSQSKPNNNNESNNDDINQK